jgi:undecaprenyl-diphosphatase
MDLSLFHFINGLANKFWLFDWLGIFLASYFPYFLILIAIYLLLRRGNWRESIYFFSLASLSVILSRGIITEAIRFFYHRPRPFLALEIQPLINHLDSGSFPSGHATSFFALALAVFFINKKWGWRFLVATIVIGIARIFVGVHWPSDILGGAIIGLGSAFLIKMLLPSPNTRIENAPVE